MKVSSKTSPVQSQTNTQFHLWMVPWKKLSSLKCPPMWLWDFCTSNISWRGPLSKELQ